MTTCEFCDVQHVFESPCRHADLMVKVGKLLEERTRTASHLSTVTVAETTDAQACVAVQQHQALAHQVRAAREKVAAMLGIDDAKDIGSLNESLRVLKEFHDRDEERYKAINSISDEYDIDHNVAALCNLVSGLRTRRNMLEAEILRAREILRGLVPGGQVTQLIPALESLVKPNPNPMVCGGCGVSHRPKVQREVLLAALAVLLDLPSTVKEKS